MRINWPHTKILVFGISPGFAGTPEASKTIQRVKRWMEQNGLSEEDYDWRNCTEEPGARPKLNEIELEPKLVARYQKVVCLGQIPAKWCNKQKIEHLALPHPSELNRKWNDPTTEPTVIQELQQYLNC